MLNVRRFVVVVVISDRKIFVVGGFSDLNFNIIEISCEIFDKSLN